MPPAGTGRPLWIDDPSFSIEYHVRHTALPHPGSEEQLLLLAGRIFSQQLDRSKPLWEVWMVEGLADGGFALITKTHHALIDGIAGVDIAQVVFDLGPVPAEVPHPDEPWQPAPEPSGAAAAGLGHHGPAAHRRAHGRRGGGAGHAADGGPALGARGGGGPGRGRVGRPEPGARRRR